MSQPLPHPHSIDDPGATAGADTLARVLRDGEAHERCLVAEALGYIGGETALEALIAALRDEDPDVRADAAQALARIGDPRAVPPLLDNLKEDPVGEVKGLYVKALQALGGRQAVPLLTALTVGRGEEEGVAWDDEYSEWDDWLDVQCAAVEALGALASETSAGDAVEAIRNALADPEGQDLWALASRALAALGEAGSAALAELAREASTLNRKRIAAVLAGATDERGAELLAALARDKDAQVRVAAVGAAAARGLTSVCRQALEDPAAEVRLAALASGEGGDLDDALVKAALADQSTEVAVAACAAIERGGRPRRGLELSARAERGLRTAPNALLAALISAAAVAEPAEAAELIEEIVNHPATKPSVRAACARAQGKLNRAGAVACLATAAADARREVRLEAIAALGRIAKTEGPNAAAAAKVLASAIDGALVTPPPDWQGEDDTVVRFAPRKGAQAAGEDGEARIKIDREGNIVETPTEPERQDDPAEADAREAAATPLSTLDAIQAVRPEAGGLAELDDADLAFLEMTASRMSRRRQDPDKAAPAHLDVRRLAARVAGETAKQALVPALARAALDTDGELSEAAIEALSRLADAGADMANAEDALVRQALAANRARRCRALASLADVRSPAAVAAIEAGLSDASPEVRAAALGAADAHGMSLDLAGLGAEGEERCVRQAAALLLARRPSTEAVPALLGLALAENSIHQGGIAGLLAGYGDAGVAAALAWVGAKDARRHLTALSLLPAMLRRTAEADAATGP